MRNLKSQELGSVERVSVVFEPVPSLAPRYTSITALPRYVIIGGLVWTQYSMPLRSEAKHEVPPLTDFVAFMKWKKGDEEIVVLGSRLTDSVNEFYEVPRLEICRTFNNKNITNLATLVKLYWQNVQEQAPFLTFSMSKMGANASDRSKLANPPTLVLNASLAINDMRLLHRHQVPKPVSDDLQPLYCEMGLQAKANMTAAGIDYGGIFDTLDLMCEELPQPSYFLPCVPLGKPCSPLSP